MDSSLKTLRRPTFWPPLALCFALCAGCDDARQSVIMEMNRKTIERNARVQQALRNALTTSTCTEVKAWREFLSKWPSSRQREGFAWYEGLNQFQGGVSAVTVIEDRYLFKALLDFEMGPDFQKINFRRLRFHLAEVRKVILPPEGPREGGVTTYFQPYAKLFGLEDWRRLAESGWNFSTIGITIVSNTPIPNIQSALPGL